MKRISLFVMSLFIFLLISCTSHSNIINKINKEVQSSENSFLFLLVKYGIIFMVFPYLKMGKKLL